MSESEDRIDELAQCFYAATTTHNAVMVPGPPFEAWDEVHPDSQHWYRIGVKAVAAALLPPGTVLLNRRQAGIVLSALTFVADACPPWVEDGCAAIAETAALIAAAVEETVGDDEPPSEKR